MNADELFSLQYRFFASGKTLECSWRERQLEKLKEMLLEHSGDIIHGLRQDLHKHPVEAYTSEIAPVLADIDDARGHLRSWSAPKRVSSPLLNVFARGAHYPLPYGPVLIIGPWNYPIGLSLQPLVSAVAAGNCVVIKPSEYAPASSGVLQKHINRHFDTSGIAVLPAGAKETARAIERGLPRYVFFTGGSDAGKRVMASCARHLIPVTLELGGCNPCIVEGDVPADIAARRIAWGKFFNAGQTCLAPNVCYVRDRIGNEFVGALRSAIGKFYGPDPRESSSYGRIINTAHFERLERLLESSPGRVLAGGRKNRKERYLEPTLIECRIGEDGPLLTEELFGPVLPIVTYSDIEMVLDAIGNRPPPLAVYLFSNNKSTLDRVRSRTVSGNLCINGSLDLVFTTKLPFGGVGKSGMGRYHGKAGFDTFSFRRSELRKSFFPEFSFTYPPYKTPLSMVRKAMRILLQ